MKANMPSEQGPRQVTLTPTTALGYIRDALGKATCFSMADCRVLEASMQLLAGIVAEHAQLKQAASSKPNGKKVATKN